LSFRAAVLAAHVNRRKNQRAKKMPPARGMVQRLLRPFTGHPRRVGETYWEHAAVAAGVGGRLLVMGGAALVHAALPCVLETFVSDGIGALHGELARRRRAPKPRAR
jgi:hypothetical protein